MLTKPPIFIPYSCCVRYVFLQEFSLEAEVLFRSDLRLSHMTDVALVRFLQVKVRVRVEKDLLISGLVMYCMYKHKSSLNDLQRSVYHSVFSPFSGETGMI